jgi:hypothetical protein
VAEVLVQFTEPVIRSGSEVYVARAVGAEMPDGRWQGWVEFLPVGEGEAVRSGRETTQPNRPDVVYWATGLTPVYLEGALDRALKPLTRPAAEDVPPPLFDEPTPELLPAPTAEAILNPFSVFRKGEQLLRRQLMALSEWHLVNIIRAYDLSDQSDDALNQLNAPALVEIITAMVRARSETPA